ncbi:MAG: HU family DNA-binding protein [Paludibacter sp.]|jgi:nucleoid DNA-binding protein|nr:HU family DNA-binding protein [Paludibacter sp.]
MNKIKISLQELVELISVKANVSKRIAEEFAKALFAVIEDGLLANDTVKISGLGSFKLSWNEPRRSVNINTGEEITIDGYYKANFTPDNALKEAVNEPFAHLEAVVLDSKNEKADNERLSNDPIKNLGSQAEEISDILAELTQMNKTEIETVPEVDTVPEVVEIEVLAEDNSKPEEQNIEDKAETQSIIEDETKLEDKSETDENFVEVKKRKKTWWLTILIIFVVILGLKITYFSSSCIQCWLKYDFLDEPARSKVIAVENFVNNKIDNVKGWFVSENVAPDLQIESNIEVEQNIEPAETISDSLVNEVTPQFAPVDSLDILLNTPLRYTKFIATETFRNGTRLTVLAKKYYGHKDFWVYIYEANRDMYPNPDVIPIGATIKIPVIDKRIIDANNQKCLLRAKYLHDLYVKKP